MSLESRLVFGVSKPAIYCDAKQHDMSKPKAPAGLSLYPARYFQAAPTWMHWNKLTAADVFNLKREPGFEGQEVYFHLNHPIQYIYLSGVLVEFDVVPGGKYALLTLDDGSGACIVAKIVNRPKAENDEADYPSNTLVDNVTVTFGIGSPSLTIDAKLVDVGDVIKVKGTISTFRKIRQIEVKRMSVVKDTNAEAHHWSDMAAWRRDVLSKPWVLSTPQRYGIDEKIRKAEKAERERGQKKKAMGAKFEEKRKRHEARYEAKRVELEKVMNAGALYGSNVTPYG
ncbi:Telomere regulation protein Stn1 [Teratosphaeria destructans]|uniref:Telomere regulation protein Stn1 n=1 Tax=Teratosphaeria destructans TaxID=418781 RepID=A0A9W7VYN7_9PEZI|nr:Telomere regulation protein Stn1 [Teratosphaeria destructans]